MKKSKQMKEIEKDTIWSKDKEFFFFYAQHLPHLILFNLFLFIFFCSMFFIYSFLLCSKWYKNCFKEASFFMFMHFCSSSFRDVRHEKSFYLNFYLISSLLLFFVHICAIQIKFKMKTQKYQKTYRNKVTCWICSSNHCCWVAK